MSNREQISKKIRFEVFKRDKFTCQYCGAKSPEVILNVDHIEPVAKGGSNELVNLITSCFSCNNGKSDRTLDDNSIVEKQRKQMEFLQERREQIELMLDWKKSLSALDKEIADMIVDYINTKIHPLCVNDTGKQSIIELLKKFEADKIIDSVDVSAKQYIRFDGSEIIKESVELFFNKIGGILVVKNLSPIKQKIAYIKGVARNRFSYWDDKKGSIILSNYLKELEQHWSEEQIIADLNDEVLRITKESKNWSDWRDTLEKWTDDIKNWSKPEKETILKINQREYSLEDLKDFVYTNSYEQEYVIKAIEHIASIFPHFIAENFRNSLAIYLLEFLKLYNNFEDKKIDDTELENYVSTYVRSTELIGFFKYDFEEKSLGILMVLEPIIQGLLTDIFIYCYYPKFNIKTEYSKLMIEMHIDQFNNNLKA